MSVKKVTINLEICKNTVIQLSCHNIQSKQHQYCISSGLFWLLSQQGYSLTTPHSRTAKTPKRHITTQEGIERNFTSKLAEDYEKENELPLMKWHWEGALHIPPLFLTTANSFQTVLYRTAGHLMKKKNTYCWASGSYCYINTYQQLH